MTNPYLSNCALEATIRRVRADFYSPVPETRRIAEAMKDRLIDALIPLAGSDNEELQDLAAEVYSRFLDGTEAIHPQSHEANPASNEVSA